jgi:hypothetical protein
MDPISLPTPFPIPTPGSGLDVSKLWEYENVGGAMSALQSIVILANQNRLVSVFIIIGLIAMLITAVISIVSRSGGNGNVPDSSI